MNAAKTETARWVKFDTSKGVEIDLDMLVENEGTCDECVTSVACTRLKTGA